MDEIPDVTATGADDRPVRLRDLPRPLVVYFYPKDDTPGCTREAQDFSALADDFVAAGIHVLGISRDSVARHAKFTAKHDLRVALASDLDGRVTEAFDVWGEKQMYGRSYMGVERATFLFDRDGRLAREWRKVKVPNHAAAVLDAARAL
jgi:peroxiredoxin Q/BCP